MKYINLRYFYCRVSVNSHISLATVGMWLVNAGGILAWCPKLLNDGSDQHLNWILYKVDCSDTKYKGILWVRFFWESLMYKISLLIAKLWLQYTFLWFHFVSILLGWIQSEVAWFQFPYRKKRTNYQIIHLNSIELVPILKQLNTCV